MWPRCVAIAKRRDRVPPHTLAPVVWPQGCLDHEGCHVSRVLHKGTTSLREEVRGQLYLRTTTTLLRSTTTTTTRDRRRGAFQVFDLLGHQSKQADDELTL
eukprot:3502322-Prymnesium_polylepis.2